MSLLTAGYIGTFTRVTIVDGSTVHVLHTHQQTVGGILREAGLNLLPEDVVNPPLDSRISHNLSIFVQRARRVQVRIDGMEPQVLLTQGRTVQQVLDSLGYSIGESDLVKVNGQFTSDIPPIKPDAATDIVADIEFRHAAELIVYDEGGPPATIHTTAPTIGEALMQAGYIIYLADNVRPALSQEVKSGTHVFIERSKPVTIRVDGREIRTRTHRATTADVLADLNIVLYGADRVTPSLNTPVEANMEIRVTRVSHDIVINQDVIPFDTRWTGNPDMELDTQGLAQEGAPGVRERRTLITYEDGAEVKREVIADVVVRQPQPRIYNYGTKIVVRTLDTPNGPVQYWRVLRMLATSYSASTAGVPTSLPWYGRARCGMAMRHGIVAVDPRVIPLGTNVYVDGYGPGYACDTGSAIVGKRIDLGYDDNNLKLWYRWTNVYLLTPVPDNVKYILD
ncbi:MAG: ubiquitin-like domain-containing protein [Candidatus Roseilinea sp.]|uniref:ubiquitin-like domain-containing protein n=1 Tax=Candidatus Roseilinea sp. TaxID=2838777 RepID=UPI00404B2FAC